MPIGAAHHTPTAVTVLLVIWLGVTAVFGVWMVRASVRLHRLRRRLRRQRVDRSYRAFLRAIRDKPGSKFQVGAVCASSSALALSRGAVYAAAVVLGSIVVCATVGFLAWRRWG